MTSQPTVHCVFTLTIYHRKPKDLFVLSAAPGVPLPLLAQQASVVQQCAADRKADFLLVRDCEVRVEPQPWWSRVRAACRRAMDWLMTDADQMRGAR